MNITDLRRSSAAVVLGTASNSSSWNGVTISSNTAITPGWGIVALTSNTAAWRDVFSFGSNTNDVGSVGTMGSSPSNSRADHVHRGVGGLTSSSSNTIYGTVNLRVSGSMGIALDVPTNTVTLSASGGGSGGAPTDAQYLVGTANSTLTAEKVKSALYKNYDPDDYPATGLTLSDEFDDASLDGAWSWDVAPSATVSESAFPGFLHIDGGTNATPNERNLTRAFTPGATAFTVVAKLSFAYENGNFSGSFGILVRTSAPADIWRITLTSDGTTTASDSHRIIATSGSMTGGDQLNDGWYYLMIQRDSSTNYKGFFSRNGLTWQYIGGSSVAGTVALVGFIYSADTDSNAPQAAIDFIRVFNSATKTIGA